MAVSEQNSKECNFLRQFRDKNSKEFKKFTASQFMDVWNHYDNDGKYASRGYPRAREYEGRIDCVRTKYGRLYKAIFAYFRSIY